MKSSSLRVTLLTAAALLLCSVAVRGQFFGLFSDEEPEEERSAGTWPPGSYTEVERRFFKFVYPSDWEIATYQDDYDADKNFTIDAPGDSCVKITTFETAAGDDADEIVENMIRSFDGPFVDTYSRSHFENWGHFVGKGIHLKGKVMSMFPGGCRIFVSTEGQVGIIIIEQYFSEEIQTVMPAFELIAQSFETVEP